MNNDVKELADHYRKYGYEVEEERSIREVLVNSFRELWLIKLFIKKRNEKHN